MGLALRLARQCQEYGLVKYWLKIVGEAWICELSPLNNWNTVDTYTHRKCMKLPFHRAGLIFILETVQRNSMSICRAKGDFDNGFDSDPVS